MANQGRKPKTSNYTRKQLNAMTDNEIKSLVRSMGKRMNQRLYELEKQGFRNTEGYGKQKAAALTAQKVFNADIYRITSKESLGAMGATRVFFEFVSIVPRFRTDTKNRTKDSMIQEILKLQEFQNDARSTTKSLKEVINKQYESMKKAGFKGTKEEMMGAFGSHAWSTIAKIYESDVANYIVYESGAGHETAQVFIDEHPEWFEGDGIGKKAIVAKFDDWFEKWLNDPSAEVDLDVDESILDSF